MTDIVLRDIDPLLLERLHALAQARGWDVDEALRHVLRRGLRAIDDARAPPLADEESRLLEAAIAAREHIPDDPGFALIGRVPAAILQVQGPEQSMASFVHQQRRA